jgi:hypothetical protein
MDSYHLNSHTMATLTMSQEAYHAKRNLLLRRTVSTLGPSLKIGEFPFQIVMCGPCTGNHMGHVRVRVPQFARTSQNGSHDFSVAITVTISRYPAPSPLVILV